MGCADAMKNYLWRGPDAKSSSLVLRHNLNYFIQKGPCTKFCGVLISSHDAMTLKNFEWSVTDVILANVKYISSLVFFEHFCQFYGKRTVYTGLRSFWPFLINLWSCKFLDD